jgi:hypothetical protein
MLSLDKATGIVKKAFPKGKINSSIEYKNFYIFQVFNPFPGEEGMDPFFSVNKKTGEFRDFSIITDGDITEITELFLKAQQRRKT